jgi:sugar/nucleoside kinase (ribokinase family)
VLTDFDEELDQAEKMITLTDYLVLNSDHLLKRSLLRVCVVCIVCVECPECDRCRTAETDLLAAMASLLRALPRVRFVIATLGSQGSLLMRRPHAHAPNDDADAEATTRPESDEEEGKGEVRNMDELLTRVPKYEDVEVKWQRMWAFGNAAADGDGDGELASATEEEQREADCALGLLVHTFCYRPARDTDHHAQVHYCPAYPLNPASIVDTTGAGDVFVGGVCYGLVRGLSLPQLLALASLVAARKCLGSGLDGISDRGSLPALLLRTPRAHD